MWLSHHWGVAGITPKHELHRPVLWARLWEYKSKIVQSLPLLEKSPGRIKGPQRDDHDMPQAPREKPVAGRSWSLVLPLGFRSSVHRLLPLKSDTFNRILVFFESIFQALKIINKPASDLVM